MKKVRVRSYKSRVVGAAVLALAWAAPALGQTDGTLEETYARECPQHQDNQLCNGLRKLMSDPPPKIETPINAAAIPAPPSHFGMSIRDSVTGTLGAVLNSVDSGQPADIAGLQPGDIITSIGGARVGNAADAASIISKAPVGISMTVQLVRAGKSLEMNVTPAPRPAQRSAGKLIRPGVRPLRIGDRLSLITDEKDKGWGWIWRVPCFQIEAGQGDVITIDSKAFGERSLLNVASSCYGEGNAAVAGHVDNGGARNDLAVTFRQGNFQLFATVFFRGKGKQYEIAARKLTSAEIAQWEESIRQQRLAKAQQSGDSGLFGALAMATGAALAGGNAEHVMGAAMKGAELTTDNEMSRNVLAGQGDAMVAAGTQRMAEQNARRGGVVSGASSSSVAPAGARTNSLGGPAGAGASASGGTTAHVVCYLYGQYESGRNWQFYISQVGQVQAGFGEAWPDSPSDQISQMWGNYLRQRGADVDIFAGESNPTFPICHGFRSPEEARSAKARWLSDVRSGRGGYSVIEENWAPQ